MEKDLTREYSNGEITIVWKPSACIHSTLCWKNETGLPSVFNPRLRPWIKPEGSTTDKIIEHVNKCPSGALGFYYDDKQEETPEKNTETRIEVRINGPLMVHGNVLIKDSKGNEARKNNVTALCRCGKSDNKPYCDGSHVKHNFEG